jgi:Ni/Fe-hydrogenase subunit HybB-like protein
MNYAVKLSVSRQLVRWLVLSTFIVLALLYLNSSIYSAWISGGPPNSYPLGWSRRAIGHFCFALAALCFGIGLFNGIRTFPRSTKGSAAFIVLGAILVISPYIGRFILMDKCLDRGGSWNRETIQCSDE